MTNPLNHDAAKLLASLPTEAGRIAAAKTLIAVGLTRPMYRNIPKEDQAIAVARHAFDVAYRQVSAADYNDAQPRGYGGCGYTEV